MAVRRKQIQRLPIPYASACVSSLPAELKPFAVDPSVYTISQCQTACRDYFLLRRCTCILQSYKNPRWRRPERQ